MERAVLYAVLVWWAVVSLTAVILTVYDKRAAKRRPRRRIPEKTLMWVAALGGAETMLLTMLLIRHKTLHKKFMIGLPLLIALHAAGAVAWVLLRKPF